MAQTLKRAELIVSGESAWAIERGVEYALKRIEASQNEGEHTIARPPVSLKWRITDVVVADTPEESLSLIEQERLKRFSDIPDLTKMDIEDAKGVIGVAADTEELDRMEEIENSHPKVEGGRLGVLKYIDKRREEMAEQAKAAKKAEEDRLRNERMVQSAAKGAKEGGKDAEEAQVDTKPPAEGPKTILERLAKAGKKASK